MRTILLNLLLCVSAATFVTAQTFVSTTPENKNAILEEFTGVNCGFCPDGHARANGIKEDYPDDFFIINIHQGGFANPGAGQPDFRTPFGNAIVGQSNAGGGFGYPSGTINRHNFPGREMTNAGTTAMDRGQWAPATAEIVQEPSYLNVGVQANINVSTRVLTVDVEVYYTGNSPVPTNKLNIALLQNNTLGPQAGGGMGNNYPHMHRLVHLVTGQWGADIATTTQGSLFSQTFTYTIPNDYNGIPVDFFVADMEVVAFVAEGNQNIISGNDAEMTYSGLPNDNDASVRTALNPVICDGYITPSVEVQNLGNNTITSLDFQYDVNGSSSQTYTWNGSLNALSTETIFLPGMPFSASPANVLNVSIANDDDLSNNTDAESFNISDTVYDTQSVNLTITLDNYPTETSWEILNSTGDVIHSGGPYAPSQVGATITSNNMALSEDDCYTFNIYDSYGDGICCNYGNGSYSLETSSGVEIISGGNFTTSDDITFANTTTLSDETFDFSQLKVYPNPTSGVLNIAFNTNFTYQILDLQGRVVLNGESDGFEKELNLSTLNAGLYLVKVSSQNNSETKKIILK